MSIFKLIFFSTKGGGGGKSFGGDNNRDKLTVYLIGGTMLCVSAYAIYEMSYKEITWKEFINM